MTTVKKLNNSFDKVDEIILLRLTFGVPEFCEEGPLYPFAKLNHVKIFGLFTRHE